MRFALLCDFGSTFTKVRIVDLDAAVLVGTAQAPTTAQTDLTDGFLEALRQLKPDFTIDRAEFLAASSSAAGGLRMVAIGLVPELTVAAAREAALGAGARLIGTFAYQITPADIHELERLSPDIILLTGGTDGGDSATIIHNATALASAALDVPVIYAGNRDAADRVADTLQTASGSVIVTHNVLPTLSRLEIEPARQAVRGLFVDRIMHGPGFQRLSDIFGEALVPTPLAVLEGTVLLSHGSSGQNHPDPVIVIDIGGATTDVHSVGEGAPTKPGVLWKGLPEPIAKRTVEGDLGLRANSGAIVEQLGQRLELHEHLGDLSMETLAAHAERLEANPSIVAANGDEASLDEALARTAVDVAVGRHVGRVTQLATPTGMIPIQRGKDLTEAAMIVGTGGVFARGRFATSVLEAALARPHAPEELRPRNATLRADSLYVLGAGGLLAQQVPEVATQLVLSSVLASNAREVRL